VGIINVLDISVANLIAAGEVVERPASAIKELVENSIDAGASAVTVEISKGGVSFMRVTDDGCGMSGEDAVTSVRRHATSKIHSAEDLSSILTLGFRGEALAAITAVSEFRMMTKRKEDGEGTLLSGAYGKVEEVSSAGCPDGTTIICEKLFATTPARLKFLKSDSAEGAAVAQAVERLAVSHPEIAFRFISDGALKFATMGDGKLQNAIYAVYGGAFATRLIAVNGSSGGIAVEGYASAPDNVRGNRGMQQFFINSRSVRSKTLTASLEAAYRSYIPSDKFPSCVLNLKIPASLVDVNIHPAKLEVKFSNEKAVFDALYSAVRGTLEHDITRPELSFSGKGTRTEKISSAPAASVMKEVQTPAARTPLDLLFEKAAEKGAESEIASRDMSRANAPSDSEDDTPVDVPQLSDNRPATGQQRLGSDTDIRSFEMRERLYGAAVRELRREEPYKPVIREETDAKIAGAASHPVPEYRIVGEVFNCYVILETEEKMIIFDKHAAHERINFERLRANMSSDTPNVRMLLEPISLPLTAEEAQICREYKPELEKVGFEFDASDREASLRAIPEDFGMSEAKELFLGLVTGMLEGGEPIETRRRSVFEKALYQSSCKASIKGGRVYDEAHIRWICDNLLRYDCIKFCPHGRPVAFEIGKKELERRFGRT
jgi:DNA mismatch repair protein mutL